MRKAFKSAAIGLTLATATLGAYEIMPDLQVQDAQQGAATVEYRGNALKGGFTGADIAAMRSGIAAKLADSSKKIDSDEFMIAADIANVACPNGFKVANYQGLTRSMLIGFMSGNCNQ